MGNFLEYLKRGLEQKRGKGKQRFKKEGKLGQSAGALKGRRAGTPIRTMCYDQCSTQKGCFISSVIRSTSKTLNIRLKISVLKLFA